MFDHSEFKEKLQTNLEGFGEEDHTKVNEALGQVSGELGQVMDAWPQERSGTVQGYQAKVQRVKDNSCEGIMGLTDLVAKFGDELCDDLENTERVLDEDPQPFWLKSISLKSLKATTSCEEVDKSLVRPPPR